MAAVTYAFTGKPTSITLASSGNYTVPAGKYAFVTASCKDGGSITISGTTVLNSSSSTWSVLSTSPVTVKNGASSFVGLATDSSATGSNGAAFVSATASMKNNVSGSYWLPSGTVVAIVSDGALCASEFSG